jgi:hypothetical protein
MPDIHEIFIAVGARAFFHRLAGSTYPQLNAALMPLKLYKISNDTI